MCAECYDYVGHVVWQYHAPELWRRFTIRLRRELARSLCVTQRAAARVVRLQFAKVAEFQRRGIVHFHAIIRLDGIHTELPFPAPPVAVSTDHLVAAIQSAVKKTSVAAAPLPGDVKKRTLTWGKQSDVRPIVRRDGLDGALSDRAVAAYIAKYATKATEDLEPTGAGRDHIKRIKLTVRELAAVVDLEGPYEQLHRWDGMLGFRGHFSTKSRRYSVTLGSLRGARRSWRLEHLLARTTPTEEISPDEVAATHQVEVRVMDLANYGPDSYGVVMMRNAFNPDTGPPPAPAFQPSARRFSPYTPEPLGRSRKPRKPPNRPL